MSLYQIILKLEQLDYFPELIKKGIIPAIFIDYKVIYEYYLSQVPTLHKSEKLNRSHRRKAKVIAAEEFNLSEAQVYKIVRKLEYQLLK